jgi:hypothetical protein
MLDAAKIRVCSVVDTHVPIGLLVLHDAVADVLRNSWPTSLRLPFPKQLETLAMPADQGLGFDDDQGLFPIAQSRPKD